jgi:hypothetical protein
MTTQNMNSFVLVYCRALVALRVTTVRHTDFTLDPGAVFAVCPYAAASAWRAGLVETVTAPTPETEGALFAFQHGTERENIADWREHGGAQFSSQRTDFAMSIERAPTVLPAAKPIVLNLGGGEVGEKNLLPTPTPFLTQ